MKYAAMLLLIAGLAYATAPDITFKAMMEVGIPSTYTYLTGVAWDGTNYYAINGGDSQYGKIAVYSSEGIFLRNINTIIDGRGIVYANGKIYAKDNNNTIYELKNDTLEKTGEYAFQTDKSKIAITPDGRQMLDHYQGKVVRYSFPEGNKISEVTLNPPLDGYEQPARPYQIATDGYYMYFITGPKIYYYNPDGKLIGTDMLEQGPQPEPSLDEWSLSYTNGRIWVYKCVRLEGVCTDDNLYGYKISVPPIPQPSAGGSGGAGVAGGAGGAGGPMGLGGIIKPKPQAQEAAAGNGTPAAEQTAQAAPAGTVQENTNLPEKSPETPGYKTPQKTAEGTGNQARIAIAVIAVLAIMVVTWMRTQGSAKQRTQSRDQRQTGSKNRL